MTTVVDAGIVESFDVDQHCEAISPTWSVTFNQLSKGRFHGRLDFVNTGRLLMYRERWSQRLHVYGTSSEGCFMIGATAAKDFVWDGGRLGKRNLAVKQSGTEVDFTASASDHAVLIVPPDVLITHLGEERALQLLRESHTLACPPNLSDKLTRIVRGFTERYAVNHQGLNEQSETQAIETELMSVLADINATEPARMTRAAKSKRQRALLDAIERTRNLRRPLPIPELSRDIGVSQRTLEYAFNDAFGISPTRFLRWRRMNGLRRQLLEADPADASATQLGLVWGFGELGRLAVEHRQLFGESPSATLARRMQVPKVRLASRPGA